MIYIVTSFLFAIPLIIVYGKFADSKNIVSYDRNKIELKKIPEGTGIILLVISIFVLSISSLYCDINTKFLSLTLSTLIVIGLIGYYDDLKQLTVLQRTIIPLVLLPYCIYSFNGLMIIVALVILVCSLGLTNTFEGINGQASGSSLILLLFLSVLSEDKQFRILNYIFIGGTIGLLYFNRYPARYFIGNSGTYLLGIVIGMIILSFNVLLFLFYIPNIIDFFLKAFTNFDDMSEKKRPVFLKNGKFISLPDGKLRLNLPKSILLITKDLKEWQLTLIVWGIVFVNDILVIVLLKKFSVL